MSRTRAPKRRTRTNGPAAAEVDKAHERLVATARENYTQAMRDLALAWASLTVEEIDELLWLHEDRVQPAVLQWLRDRVVETEFALDTAPVEVQMEVDADFAAQLNAVAEQLADLGGGSWPEE